MAARSPCGTSPRVERRRVCAHAGDGGGDVRPGRRASVRVRWRGRHRQGMGPAPIRAGSYPEWSPSTRLRARRRRGRPPRRRRVHRDDETTTIDEGTLPARRFVFRTRRSSTALRLLSRGFSTFPRRATAGVAGMLISTAARFGDDDDAPEGAAHARQPTRRAGGRTLPNIRRRSKARPMMRTRGVPVHPAHRGGAAELRGGVRGSSTRRGGDGGRSAGGVARRRGPPVRRGPQLAEWAGDQGRWPVVDAEVTQEGCAVLDGESESDDDEA